MNRKDIALTVAGVVATMGLAYVFYRQQQKTAATAAASTVDTQDVNDPNQGLYDASMAYQYAYAAQLSQVGASSASSTSSLAPAVDTSATTAATGTPPESTGTDLLSQIINGYFSQQTPDASSSYSSLAIPTLQPSTADVISTAGIPVTAQQAQQQIMQQSSSPGFQQATCDMEWINPQTGQTGGCGTGTISTNQNLTSSGSAAVPPPTQQAPASSTAPAITLHDNHIAAGYYAA